MFSLTSFRSKSADGWFIFEPNEPLSKSSFCWILSTTTSPWSAIDRSTQAPLLCSPGFWFWFMQSRIWRPISRLEKNHITQCNRPKGMSKWTLSNTSNKKGFPRQMLFRDCYSPWKAPKILLRMKVSPNSKTLPNTLYWYVGRAIYLQCKFYTQYTWMRENLKKWQLCITRSYTLQSVPSSPGRSFFHC